MTRWVRAAGLASVLGVTLVATGAQAQAGGAPFEGVVTMRMSTQSPQGTQSQLVEYLVRGGKLRMNVTGAMGGMAMIAVPQEKKMYLLMAAQNAYMEMALPEALPEAPASAKGASVPVNDAKVTRTGRMERVAGLSCEHVQMTVGSEVIDVCLTRELGRFVNPLDAMRPSARASWQGQIANQFPLRVTKPDGSIPLEVTKVERKRLANDLFSVPEQYRKMTMPSGRPPRN